MIRTVTISVFALCLFAAAGFETARGDIVTPGTRSVKGSFAVDFGAWNDITERGVTVGRGDTLGTLALRYLGDAFRWTEIVDTSGVSIDPKSIKPGQKLVLPPKRSPMADEKAMAFFAVSMRGGLFRLRLGETYESQKYGATILAVPVERAEEFTKLYASGKEQRKLHRARLPEWISRSNRVSVRTVVDENSKTRAVETTFHIKSVKDHKIEVTSTERHLDKDGESITSYSGARRQRDVFAGLSVVGLAGLAMMILRRRGPSRA